MAVLGSVCKCWVSIASSLKPVCVIMYACVIYMYMYVLSVYV